jgi:hypothetical protein
MGLCSAPLEGVEGAGFVPSIGLRFGSDLHRSMSYYRACSPMSFKTSFSRNAPASEIATVEAPLKAFGAPCHAVSSTGVFGRRRFRHDFRNIPTKVLATHAAPANFFLLDLDGTLVDSVYQHVLAWHEALETEGINLSIWRIAGESGVMRLLKSSPFRLWLREPDTGAAVV